MTWASYFALPAMNWSRLKVLDESPKHFRHAEQNPTPQTEAQALGCYVHTATLQPDQVSAEYAIWTGGRRQGAAWDTFCAENADKAILREQDIAEAAGMIAALRAHPYVVALLADSDTVIEDVVTWLDESGTDCKGRPDIRNRRRKLIADVKTAKSAEVGRFGHDVTRYKYHGQLAFYADGIAAAEGWTSEEHVLIVVEKIAPYDVAIFPVGADAIAAGREKYRELLTLYRECVESGNWPGRYPEPVTLDATNLPPWMFGGGVPDFAFESEV